MLLNNPGENAGLSRLKSGQLQRHSGRKPRKRKCGSRSDSRMSDHDLRWSRGNGSDVWLGWLQRQSYGAIALLPVQQFTKAELIINLNTANALGITVAITLLGHSLLLRPSIAWPWRTGVLRWLEGRKASIARSPHHRDAVEQK